MAGSNPRADRRGEVARPAELPPTRDLAGALHEVSNALTVMLGWLERARTGTAHDASSAHALDVAISRARLARTIARRAIGAELPPEPPRSVAEIVSDAAGALEPEAKRAKVGIETLVTGDLELLSIEGASTVLQILTNLLLNALAFSPSGSTVVVEAIHDVEADRVVFAVIDEGPGIPAARHPDLFEAGLSTRSGGAGIGLRHAAALARETGGALSIAPATRGTRFELRWPRVQSDDVESSPASVRGTGVGGMRVLVLEDDRAVVDLLDMALSARGAEVVAVRTVGELQAALADGRYEAVLVDISPIESDIEGALRALRDANPDACIVLVSGTAVVLPTLPTEWFDAWVRKPFEVGEIVRALARGRVAR